MALIKLFFKSFKQYFGDFYLFHFFIELAYYLKFLLLKFGFIACKSFLDF